MSLPVFFYDGLFQPGAELHPDEETARHIVQVLRMQPGAGLLLTDGKGNLAETVIARAEKKKCTLQVLTVKSFPQPAARLHLGVAFTKNASRNEWLLEKATELGVSSIIPVLAARTERERIRYDRWHNILVAALIQSRQHYLPDLTQATPLDEILQRFNGTEQKLVGHCIEGEPRLPLPEAMQKNKETIILIGPEGDFSPEEVALCAQQGYRGVLLGNQRLRTETAAMAVCAYFNLINS